MITKTKHFYSAGLGDIIVFSSHWPEVPDEIYWASRARPDFQPLFETLYPHIKHHNCWQIGDDQERYFYSGKTVTPYNFQCPDDVEDWSVASSFLECRFLFDFHTSPFLTNTLTDLHITLPKRYYVCQHDTPYNSEEMRRNRSLDAGEWRWLLDKGLPVVVLGSDKSYPTPRSKQVINLCGKTSLAESIEILKRAEGYWGIDSWLSICAAQLFPADRLGIHWHGTWFRANQDVYMRPHTTFPFLHKRLGDKVDKIMDTTTVLLKKIVYYDGNTALPGGVLHVEKKIAADWIKHGLAVDYTEPTEHIAKVKSELEQAFVQAKRKKRAAKAVANGE